MILLCSILLLGSLFSGVDLSETKNAIDEDTGLPITDCKDEWYGFCLNDGTCQMIIELNIPKCICPEYYEGERCGEYVPYDQVDFSETGKSTDEQTKRPITECSDELDGFCLNGGTCRMIIELNAPSCQCPEHFGGERCQEHLFNHIITQEVKGDESFQDLTEPKYAVDKETGLPLTDCSEPWDGFCLNGGICQVLFSIDVARCLCPNFYEGERCNIYVPYPRVPEEEIQRRVKIYQGNCPEPYPCKTLGVCSYDSQTNKATCLCRTPYRGGDLCDVQQYLPELLEWDPPCSKFEKMQCGTIKVNQTRLCQYIEKPDDEPPRLKTTNVPEFPCYQIKKEEMMREITCELDPCDN